MWENTPIALVDITFFLDDDDQSFPAQILGKVDAPGALKQKI